MNGAIIGAAFGLAWGLAGAMALPKAWQGWAVGFSIIISSVLILALACGHKHRPVRPFRARLYGTTVVVEVVAILATTWFLGQLRMQHLVMPAIGLIVGLHFLGLWKATNLRVFLWTALAMCLVCGLAALLPGATASGSVDLRRLVTGLGSALILWGACAWGLVRPEAK